MTDQKKQLVIIGAGPGGYAAAFLAADLGLDVCLIDKRSNPGGVCLYEGCIPSKAYLHAANLLQNVKEAGEMGIDFGQPKVNIERLRQWKNGIVKKLTGGLGGLSRSRNIRYLQGTAKFLSPNEIAFESPAGEKSKINFTHAILACGSVIQNIPSFPQSPMIMNSTTALQLEEIPKRLLVIGGGYIGLEMSTVYANLGSQVSVVETASQLLPGTDPDLVSPLAKRLDSLLHEIHLETQADKISIDGNTVRVVLKKKGSQEKNEQNGKEEKIEKSFDKILVSVGRRPSLEGLGIENTAIKKTDQGFVQVDEQRRTTEPNIYAVGDITGQPMLAHKAAHEGKTAVEAICGQKGAAFVPNAIPAVIFTDPEIAYCGMMEEEAKAKGLAVKTARFPWSASGRALSLHAADGITKMIIDEKSGRILGLGLVGRGAGELIAEGVLAVEMGALAKDLALSIHPHPTLSETLMECSEIFSGSSTHIHSQKKTRPH